MWSGDPITSPSLSFGHVTANVAVGTNHGLCKKPVFGVLLGGVERAMAQIGGSGVACGIL